MEKIICSAVWYPEILIKQPGIPNQNPINIDKGAVFCGFRHCHCMYTMVAITGFKSCESEVGKIVEGFLTNKNRFVTREEAWLIAEKENQLILERTFKTGKLYSENIY